MKPIKRNILLNPGPATTTDTVKYAQVVPDICPREKEFGELVENVLADLVKIAHGEKEYVCVPFIGSGTASVDACINSVVPQGKKILVINNGAYGKRMLEITDAYSIGSIKYEIPFGAYPDMQAFEEIIKQHKDEISHIGIIHHETTTGMLNPIEDALKLARKYNLEIIVDTISSYAGVPINLEQTDYDFIVSTSNKNIQGIAGISFVICKKSALEKSKDIKKRSFYLNLYQQYWFFKNKKQMQFTPAVQIFYALRQAIKEYFEEGEQNRWLRYSASWEALMKGLRKLGFKFLLPDSQQSKLLTTIMNPEDEKYNFNEMHDYLYERGFTIYPGKISELPTFRIANMGAIDKTDIANFLKVLEEYLKKCKINKM